MTSAPIPATRVWQRAEPVTYSLVDWDVIVVGAGNAGMSASHAARERGCRVLVLEKAEPEWTGGNSAFTAGAIRLAHGGLEDLRGVVEDDERFAATELDPYTEDEFLADMRRVTLGRGDAEMARILVADSGPAVRWLRERGLRFRLMYERQAYEVDGRHRFWGGLALGTVDGGEGLMAQHRAAAERSGIELRHGAAVVDLLPGGGVVLVAGGRGAARPRRRARGRRLRGQPAPARRVPRAELGRREGPRDARTTPARCWRRRSRSAPRPTATGAAATRSSGTPTRPPTGDRELTNRFSRQSYPVGLVVNARGERFLDEGADFRNYTYARYGAEVLRQPEGIAAQVFDQRSVGLLRTIDYEAPGAARVEAGTLGELADGLGIDAEGFERTVTSYNAAVQPGEFDPSVKDGKRTEGIAPPKSNWALPLDAPPFVGFRITCGITFTFGGVRVDEGARVLDRGGRVMPGLCAAGELVGGLFFHNYPGGTGLTAGMVFGRRAGYSAATHAQT